MTRWEVQSPFAQLRRSRQLFRAMSSRLRVICLIRFIVIAMVFTRCSCLQADRLAAASNQGGTRGAFVRSVVLRNFVAFSFFRFFNHMDVFSLELDGQRQFLIQFLELSDKERGKRLSVRGADNDVTGQKGRL